MNLSDNKPLLPDDCDFLQNIYCPVPPGNQFLVDLSSFDTEKIQGYAIVLKLIDGKKLNAPCLLMNISLKRFSTSNVFRSQTVLPGAL